MSPLNIAATAFQIAEHLSSQTVVYLCDDEQQAEALSAALAALVPETPVIFLPSSDALPGDVASASPANVGRRTAALRRLRELAAGDNPAHVACILSGEAAAQRYQPPKVYERAPPILTVGDTFDPDAFAEMLFELGYVADDRVDEPGEIALRGGVIDIFPADSEYPARLDIAEGKIGAIRSYDPVSQRSTDDRTCLEIGRATEPLSREFSSILAHLPVGAIGMAQKADARRKRFIALAGDAAKRGGGDVEAVGESDWQEAVQHWTSLDDAKGADPAALPRFVEQEAPLAACLRFLRPLLTENRSLVLVGSARDMRFVRPRLEKRLGMSIDPLAGWPEVQSLASGSAGALLMPADRGFVDADRVVLAAGDLLGSRALLDDPAGRTAGALTMRSEDLRIGDVVVHEDHGIGRVVGLEPGPGGSEHEMIALEYADGGRRLVAPSEANCLWRYGADPDAITLDRLDGKSWLKRRTAIDEAVAESARSLAALAEERSRLEGIVLDPDPADYERFVSGFAFNETADQARAIAAVRDDLASGRPMDRLVIGDVGYGKTEVALRAAALTALAGHQVVIAAPTTVLVRQHLETFQRRFSDSGITVAGLSRLSSAAEKKAVKAGLADGSIDVVIGTGAVMSKTVRYARLGLVVIDEEQRFGAADKARLRGDGRTHVLTLSATPIPRTLQMALVGLQTMSLITTPPARRQPIRTSVDSFDDARIRTALMREKGRGGQSFVVVPRIEDMAKLGERLRRLVPDLSIVEAHGKMPAGDIDAAMVDFADGRGDVLLATNIIEAGLDIPRANTMIVWRADRFGLAQLHQLRGRVGRGNRRGQVYLLTDDETEIGDRTLKRLRTLATFDRLGAGFEISAQDLDMRGGGDLTGETQAGHMKLIGVDLYQHLLEGALRAARGEPVEDWTPDIRTGSEGSLPAEWIPEADMRLGLYAKLSRLPDASALDSFEEELLDRFGPLPPAAAALITRVRIGLYARTARVARIDAGPAAIALTPRPDFAANPAEIGMNEKEGRWLLAERTSDDDRLEQVQQLLEQLAD